MSRRPIDFKILRDLIAPRQILRPRGWIPTGRYGLNDRGPCPLCEIDERRHRVLIVGTRVVKCMHCGFFGDGWRCSAPRSCELLRGSTPTLCSL